MNGLHVAVVGASGAVGRTMWRVLEERAFPIDRLRAVASNRSAGKSLHWAGHDITIEALESFDFAGVDVALFSAGAERSRAYAPKAREAGAVVIDNSSAFRMDADVPLVVPEVNAAALEGRPTLIANPNCSTIQLVMALQPLHAAAGLRRVTVATYQSVSGAGSAAVFQLIQEAQQIAARWPEGEWPVDLTAVAAPPDVKSDDQGLPQRIAFNLIPHIDSLDESGYTGEELKMIRETQKILDLPDLSITATCVRVPVLIAHAEAVVVELKRSLKPDEAAQALSAFPGVVVQDAPADGVYPMPVDVDGHDEVYVGRIRRDLSCKHGISMWVVADNLRKGAATNAIQIAEHLFGVAPQGTTSSATAPAA